VRIQASTAISREKTFEDGSVVLAMLVDYPAAEVRNEMFRCPTEVKTFCSKMYSDVAPKTASGRKRQRKRGAGRLLNWGELLVSHPAELRAFAEKLHAMCEAGEDTASGAGTESLNKQAAAKGYDVSTPAEAVASRKRVAGDNGATCHVTSFERNGTTWTKAPRFASGMPTDTPAGRKAQKEREEALFKAMEAREAARLASDAKA